jgi:hypothetical protein
MSSAKRLSSTIDDQRVSALLDRPTDAWALYVLAHGAGRNAARRFSKPMSRELACAAVATLRYHFPIRRRRQAPPDTPCYSRPPFARPSRAARRRAAAVRRWKIDGRPHDVAGAGAGVLPAYAVWSFSDFRCTAQTDVGVTCDASRRVTIPMLFVQGRATSSPISD